MFRIQRNIKKSWLFPKMSGSAIPLPLWEGARGRGNTRYTQRKIGKEMNGSEVRGSKFSDFGIMKY
jgi:hypothetical protein